MDPQYITAIICAVLLGMGLGLICVAVTNSLLLTALIGAIFGYLVAPLLMRFHT